MQLVTEDTDRMQSYKVWPKIFEVVQHIKKTGAISLYVKDSTPEAATQ